MNRRKSILQRQEYLILATAIVALFVIFVIVVAAKDTTDTFDAASEPHTAAKPTTTEPTTAIPEETASAAWQPDESDVILIAKTLYGECRGVESTRERAAVVWCILNRVDASGYACGRSIEYVITFKNQFAYDENAPVWESLKEIAYDVLIRWHDEKQGAQNVGRVLPPEYIYFIGDGKRNHFSVEWKSKTYWDWSLPSPYED